ncbi:MAG: carboxylating nicotinate-nucleotide diphosphorylase [Planctomycetota bacterium]
MSAVETSRVPHELLDVELDRFLDAALAEDLGGGDVTTEVVVPAAAHARARLVAKQEGVLAGVAVFVRVFERLTQELVVRPGLADGARLAPGTVVLELEGPARALLSGERTALNLVQRLSGIATLTARFVAAARPARVLDTRKTTPLLRRLEKYAVTCGGGENHRLGLHDEVMVKNNHLDFAGVELLPLLKRLREVHGPRMRITAEARDEREALAGIAGDADVLLLDNFTPAALAELCPRLRSAARGRPRRLELEASGGLTLANVGEFARAGVERVSIGALTHSAPALDLSLRLEPAGRP